MEIKDRIIEALKKASGAKKIDLEFPENETFGDYTTNIALILAKEKGENSRALAEDLVRKLQEKDEQSLASQSPGNLESITEKVEVAGPGFINFWLTRGLLVNELEKIQKEEDRYGKSDLGKGKTVVIDYSSPNIAKPFGIGHLRSTIIGQALYNLYKFLGYEVVGDNHLGDWGTQFGKLIYMIKREKLTDFSIDKLEELYTEFHKLAEDPNKVEELESEARKWFKKLEDGDAEAKSIWQKCFDVSMKEFDRIYEMLGVNIDSQYGESFYQKEMKNMLSPGSKIWNYVTNGGDGAQLVTLVAEGIKTPLMLLKSDGATTYATRDLAAIIFRERKWDPDIIIYEVGAEQSLHFQQLFAAAKLLGLVKNSVELVHTAHGLYLAPDGKKFATRKGKTIKLEEVLDEAIDRAKKLGNESEKVAKEVGIGAIKYYDLMHSVQSNVVFDWEKMMNLEGNSGPYLQYTVARCNSVLNKANNPISGAWPNQNLVTQSTNKFENGKLKMENEELAVLRALIRFSEVIESAAKSYSPNLLCNYIYDLAQKYNGFYNKHKIIGSDNEDFRLALTFSVGQVLKNGLKLLGIEAPERM